MDQIDEQIKLSLAKLREEYSDLTKLMRSLIEKTDAMRECIAILENPFVDRVVMEWMPKIFKVESNV